MENEALTCPLCHASRHIYKVSQIYLESIKVFDKNEPHPVFDEMFAMNGKDIAPLPSRFSHEFTHLFAPPSGRAELLRPIHPDLIVFVFTVIMFFFLYNIYAAQPGVVYPFLIILGAAFLGYFAFRKKLVSRYEADLAGSKTEYVSVEQAVARWMKLYYCATEGIVFDPETQSSVPLDEMKKFLMKA